MLQKLNRFILPIVLFIMGIHFVNDYFYLIKNNRVNELEQLIDQGQKTQGLLNESYKQKTLTKARMPVDVYEIGYTFSVGNKKYEGSKVVYQLPNNKTLEVTYLKENPKINAISPKDELNSLSKDKGNTSKLLLGIGFIIIGSLWGYRKFQSINTSEKPDNKLSKKSKNHSIKPTKKNIKSTQKKEVKNSPLVIQKPKKKLKTTTQQTKSKKVDSQTQEAQRISVNKKQWSEIKNIKRKEFEPTDHSKYIPKR